MAQGAKRDQRSDIEARKLLTIFRQVAAAVGQALEGLDDWGLAGTRPGQYRSDLIADEVAVGLLDQAGLGVLSEESGLHHPERSVLVALDPVDGSTNASRHLPWWATSLCALDEDGPWAAVVVNQATGTTFEAIRGGGAWRDGASIHPSGATRLGDSMLALSGLPDRHLGWRQFRALGAAALDLCAGGLGGLRRLHRLQRRRPRTVGLPRRVAGMSRGRGPGCRRPRPGARRAGPRRSADPRCRRHDGPFGRAARGAKWPLKSISGK